ncbi:FAD-dependent oxidoreductase [Nonomuraea sp. KC401]|uniref:FAD-dependent monooxygenase n=1 Tax=unclassified Nonomuraea TaxID=2593643 RepID=UPI0010FCEB62|nr:MULTISPECIES: FAD-dependent monooxygenase [unclassified Nonomuraea]NBE98441.1 FAD-dependent oxidoreductase [Nonomuraea sp. K271]TLF60994.1 FAD-dependent oxidoreductase [Nonomuraea sp. KC401]
MRNQTILISGGGIAGPALAFWLRRLGFAPTVVERAGGPRDGGQAVDFRGAALEVTRRMGLYDAIHRARTAMGAVSYVDGLGRHRATLPAEIMSGEVEILRGDLVHILHNATRNDTEYLFGDSIAAMDTGDDGVAVSFASGATRTFDLVVGADGLHSNVRALTFGDESQFSRYLGYHLSIFTVPNFLGLEYTGHFYNVPGKLAGMYSARDNTEARALFYFASPPLGYDHRDDEQQKKILEQRFAGESWEVTRLLKEMWNAPDFYFDSTTQIRLPSYSRGRVALLGDAGYCASTLSGGGSCLAVVGAYVLAGELARARGDHETAFARYESRMRGYVDANMKLAEGAGNWLVPPSGTWIRMRNLNYRLLPYMPWKGLITKTASQAANAIELEDYGP